MYSQKDIFPLEDLHADDDIPLYFDKKYDSTVMILLRNISQNNLKWITIVLKTFLMTINKKYWI